MSPGPDLTAAPISTGPLGPHAHPSTPTHGLAGPPQTGRAPQGRGGTGGQVGLIWLRGAGCGQTLGRGTLPRERGAVLAPGSPRCPCRSSAQPFGAVHPHSSFTRLLRSTKVSATAPSRDLLLPARGADGFVGGLGNKLFQQFYDPFSQGDRKTALCRWQGDPAGIFQRRTHPSHGSATGTTPRVDCSGCFSPELNTPHWDPPGPSPAARTARFPSVQRSPRPPRRAERERRERSRRRKARNAESRQPLLPRSSARGAEQRNQAPSGRQAPPALSNRRIPDDF